MQVKVLIRKVRNKAAGTIGEFVFKSVTTMLIWCHCTLIRISPTWALAEPSTEAFQCICR